MELFLSECRNRSVSSTLELFFWQRLAAKGRASSASLTLSQAGLRCSWRRADAKHTGKSPAEAELKLIRHH